MRWRGWRVGGGCRAKGVRGGGAVQRVCRPPVHIADGLLVRVFVVGRLVGGREGCAVPPCGGGRLASGRWTGATPAVAATATTPRPVPRAGGGGAPAEPLPRDGRQWWPVSTRQSGDQRDPRVGPALVVWRCAVRAGDLLVANMACWACWGGGGERAGWQPPLPCGMAGPPELRQRRRVPSTLLRSRGGTDEACHPAGASAATAGDGVRGARARGCSRAGRHWRAPPPIRWRGGEASASCVVRNAGPPSGRVCPALLAGRWAVLALTGGPLNWAGPHRPRRGKWTYHARALHGRLQFNC